MVAMENKGLYNLSGHCGDLITQLVLSIIQGYLLFKALSHLLHYIYVILAKIL